MDGLISDLRILWGIKDDTMRARPLREEELTLESCIDISRTSAWNKFCAVQSFDRRKLSALGWGVMRWIEETFRKMRVGMRKIAKGWFHVNYVDIVSHWPAHWKTCNALHSPNHFTSVCRADWKEVHAVEKEGTSNEQAFFIGALNERKYTENERYINLKVKEKCIPFNIDTGAHDNVVLESICKKKCILCGSKKSI